MNNHISSYYHKYTKSELKIADYILKNDISFQSIVELAKAIKVGEATILRFCKKIGFSGFYDFKIAYIKNQKQDVVKENLSSVENIYKVYSEILEFTKERYNHEAVEEACKLICDSKDILIFGVGNSGITALHAEAALQRRAYLARSVIDPHFQSIISATLNNQSLIIAVSLSGYTKDILDAVKIAKENGAKVIAITNFKDSNLGNMSDVTLLTSSKENPLEGGALSSKVSQVFVFDLLLHELDMVNIDKVDEIKEKTAKAISKKIVY